MANEKLPRYQISVNPEDSEEGEELGMTQIAYTSTPAILVKGMAFNLNKTMVFADELKYRLAAPAMIPDMPIYREDPEMGPYEVVFSRQVIEKLRSDFMAKKAQAQFNIEHNSEVEAPSYILDSWITGPSETDPSFTKYGIKVPEGSWFVVSQFTDKEFFKNEIMAKDRVGYSIEGFLGLSLSLSKFAKQEFETYNDYPQQATENAKIALRYAEENGWGSCGTPVGKARANQLANRENISRDTIARMASFARHQENSDKELGDGCGRLMWLAWGGDAGVEWAQRKLEQIDNVELSENKNNENKNENQMKMKFEKAMLADGTPIYVSELKVGGEVRVVDENGNSVPVFDAEHKLEDGSVVVTVDGKITEIKPAVEAEMAEDVAEDAIVEDEATDAIEEEMAEDVIVEAPIVEAPEDIKGYIDGKIDELLAIIAELKSEIEAAKPEIEVEMKKKPASMADNFAAFKRFK